MSSPMFDHLAAAKRALASFLASVCERERHLHGQRLFSIAVHGWLLANTLLLLPYYDAIWGPASLVNRPEFAPDRWTHWLVYLSLHPSLADHAWLFVTGQLFCLGLVLTPMGGRLASVGVYFFTFNLYHRTGQLLDGGNNLVELLLFYFIGMNLSGRATTLRTPWLRALGTAVSNASLWLCRVQIAIVYLCAGILKLTGPLWQKGMALYYILQGESYTHPLAHSFVTEYPAAAMLANYATMAFQILFVVLIWRRAARPWLIAAGVSLHLLGIAMGMGLLFFGLIMCLAYTAFIPEDVAAKVRRPWVAALPLRVRLPATGRVRWLVRQLARLDFRRRLELVDDAGANELHTVDPVTGAQAEGLAAMWAVARRLPMLAPLLPLLFVAWYVGLVQLGWRRWLAPAAA